MGRHWAKLRAGTPSTFSLGTPSLSLAYVDLSLINFEGHVRATWTAGPYSVEADVTLYTNDDPPIPTETLYDVYNGLQACTFDLEAQPPGTYMRIGLTGVEGFTDFLSPPIYVEGE